jgi:putative ABC transport system permease protein
MIKSYLLSALRNMSRNKLASMINILGLSACMASGIILFAYVLFELSYDRFHTHSDQIFRINTAVSVEGVVEADIPKTVPGAGPALAGNFPEVQAFVRFWPIVGKVNLSYNDASFSEEGVLLTDSSFFKVFDFKLLKGNKDVALSDPNSVVITASAAKRYFGSEDPYEKILVLQEGALKLVLKVTGVVEDVPKNSHMKFDFLVSMRTLMELRGRARWEATQWSSAQFYTYVLFNKKPDVGSFNDKMNKLISTYIHWEGKKVALSLQDVEGIHLGPSRVQEMSPNGSSAAVYGLSAIALLILVIGWINYINLATATAENRSKEVGLRKCLGAVKPQLVTQFLTDSFLAHIFSFVVALGITLLVLPAFEAISDKPLGEMIYGSTTLWFSLMTFIVIGTLAASFYPAIVLSSMEIVKSLKGASRIQSRNGFGLRDTLVLVQICSSLFLIVVTITVSRQVNYMTSRDLGMEISNVVVLPYPDVIDSTFISRSGYFQSEMLKHKDIQYCSFTSCIPGQSNMIIGGGLRDKSESQDAGRSHYAAGVDYDFLNVFGMELIAGRNFSKEHSTDNRGIIINETAVKLLGYASPAEAIGREVMAWVPEGSGFVVGVVKDYHQKSLKDPIDPMVLFLDPTGGNGYIAIKQRGGNPSDVVEHVRKAFATAFPGNPMDYFFMDNYYDSQYKADRQFGTVVGIFTALAIMLSCMGLLGISIHTIAAKRKEICVRKILGGGIGNILYLLLKGYFKTTVLAGIIAIPLAYYAMNLWLENYTYKVSLTWWPALLALATMLFIIFITVSYQTLTAVFVNPVKVLRSE